MGLGVLSLRRAKAEPLELELHMDQVTKEPGFSELINYRVRNSKSLCLSQFKTIKELMRTLPNLTQSAPNLRSLTLVGLRGAEWDQSADPFESSAPGLRCLKLVNIPLYSSFLRLRALTELALDDPRFTLHLDTLLDFLEENHSLKSATLNIRFAEGTLRSSRRETAITNQLQYLSMDVGSAADGKALVSRISLQRGAHLEIRSCGNAELKLVMSGVPTAQFPNLPSPVFMEYQYHGSERSIRLLGPNGGVSFQKSWRYDIPFSEFALLPVANVRELHLGYHKSQWSHTEVFNPSFFPALEVFVITCKTWLSHLLSPLLSNPSFPPSLKTLVFLDCDISAAFMEELTRFASSRKNTTTTSTWLRYVIIIEPQCSFLTTTSIRPLMRHVLVNIRRGRELPTGLVQEIDELLIKYASPDTPLREFFLFYNFSMGGGDRNWNQM